MIWRTFQGVFFAPGDIPARPATLA
jgi:hypothetical protein